MHETTINQGLFEAGQEKILSNQKNQEHIITFATPYSPPKTPKQVNTLRRMSPTNQQRQPKIPIGIKDYKYVSPSFKKQETDLSKTPRRGQEVTKQQNLNLGINANNMFHEFQSVLRSINPSQWPQGAQIKQNKKQLESSKVQIQSSSYQHEPINLSLPQSSPKTFIPPSTNANNNKFKDFLKIQQFSSQMQQTILQFKSVLGNSIIMQKQFTPKIINHKQQELLQQLNTLKLQNKQKDKLFEDKMSQALKLQKSNIIDCFKQVFNHIKRMCQNSSNESLIHISKKLFCNDPYEYEFKNSIEQLRNTVMELKIKNNEGEMLRQELNNLRKTLQQERQMKYIIEEQLQQVSNENKRLVLEDAEWKQREVEYILKVQTLVSEINMYQQQNPQISYVKSDNSQSVDIIIISQKNKQLTVAQTIIQLQQKVNSLTQQNISLRQQLQKLNYQMIHQQNQYSKQINQLKDRMKQQLQSLRHSCTTTKFPVHKKVTIQLQDNHEPIKFRPAKRKVSTSESLPEYTTDIKQQIEAILFS